MLRFLRTVAVGAAVLGLSFASATAIGALNGPSSGHGVAQSDVSLQAACQPDSAPLTVQYRNFDTYTLPLTGSPYLQEVRVVGFVPACEGKFGTINFVDIAGNNLWSWGAGVRSQVSGGVLAIGGFSNSNPSLALSMHKIDHIVLTLSDLDPYNLIP